MAPTISILKLSAQMHKPVHNPTYTQRLRNHAGKYFRCGNEIDGSGSKASIRLNLQSGLFLDGQPAPADYARYIVDTAYDWAERLGLGVRVAEELGFYCAFPKYLSCLRNLSTFSLR
jgi:hypothetical protein